MIKHCDKVLLIRAAFALRYSESFFTRYISTMACTNPTKYNNIETARSKKRKPGAKKTAPKKIALKKTKKGGKVLSAALGQKRGKTGGQTGGVKVKKRRYRPGSKFYYSVLSQNNAYAA